MNTMLISPTLNVSCSENVLLKISSYFSVSHEQAYRKGVDSLLKLTEMVIANNEHSETIKLANSNMRCDSFKSHMIINKLSKFL